MQCPDCDAFVKSSARKCPNCSHDLSIGSKGRSRGGKRTDGSRKTSKIVDKRGKDDQFGSKRPKGQEGKEEETEDDHRKADSIKMGSVFLGFAGLDAILTGATNFFFINESRMTDIMQLWNIAQSEIDTYISYAMTTLLVCNTIMIIGGIFLIIAAVLAYRKKNWQVCVLFSVLGLFTGGFLLTATILAGIGLKFIIGARREFSDFEEIDI